MSRNHRKKSFGFERLETRQMLAGDVAFTVANNTLTLFGDQAANAVLITSSSDGVVEVTGLVQVAEPLAAGQVADPTTIGGNPSKFFLNINSIVVNFNGGLSSGNKGDDVVVLTNLTLTGSVTIHSSDGDDIIALGQIDNSAGVVDPAVDSFLGPLTVQNGVTINVQAGNNKILANQVTIQGATGTNLGITGGDANDTIDLENTSVVHATSINDNGAAALTLNHFSTNVLSAALGIGNDNVSFSNVTVNSSATINANFGNDSVTVDQTHFGSLSLTLGAGNDHFTFTNSTVAQATSVDAGAGNDVVTFGSDTVHGLTVALGVGDDHLTMSQSTVGAATLAGGDGADTFSIDNLHAGSLNVTGGNGNDTLNFNTIAVTNAASIDAGANTDSVSLLHFQSNSLSLELGAGNDSAWLQDLTVAGALTVDGGAGNDSIVMLDNTSNTLTATMGNGSDHLSMAGLTVHKKTTLGGGSGQDLFSSGDGDSLGTTTRKLFEATNHSVPAPLTGV
jgi:hypothetical protein